MSSNIYIELLSELDNHAILMPYNVSGFMVKHFPMPPPFSDGHPGWNDITEKKAMDFLNEMHSRNYIRYDVKALHEKVHSINPNNEMSSNKWFHNTDFEIYFTLDGLEYLNQYRLMKSALLSNKTVIIFSKAQLFTSIIAVSVALGGLILSVINYKKDSQIKPERLEQLEKRPKQQKTQ